MEQDGIAAEPMTNNIKQKDSKKWKIAIVAVSVVAACGIGFGIYGMMQSLQKDNQISDLKVQIKGDDGTVTTIDTSEIETTTDNGTTVTITDTAKAGGPFIENGYFYIPKWEVKYKLSNDLTEYGFSVMENSEDHTFGEYLIGMSAVRKDDKISNPQAQYFDDITTCSMVTVSRVTKEKWDSIQPHHGQAAAIEKDGYVYILYDYGKSYCDISKEMGSYAIEGKTAADRMNAASEIILNSILSKPEKI